MPIMDEDVSGTQRSERDIVAALQCITDEMVRNPMAMSKSGQPLVMHYIVIREALVELLDRRFRDPKKEP